MLTNCELPQTTRTLAWVWLLKAWFRQVPRAKPSRGGCGLAVGASGGATFGAGTTTTGGKTGAVGGCGVTGGTTTTGGSVGGSTGGATTTGGGSAWVGGGKVEVRLSTTPKLPAAVPAWAGSRQLNITSMKVAHTKPSRKKGLGWRTGCRGFLGTWGRQKTIAISS